MLNVACPNCSTRYLLPDHLMGPGGARVHCPTCGRTFSVPREEASEPAREPAVKPEPARGLRGEPAARAEQARGPGSVPTSGAEAAPAPAADAAPVAREAPDASPSAHEIARAVLENLAAQHGVAITDAAARGRLFAEFGPAVLAAYDEYRRRVGREGARAPFRAALRERWGVELPEGLEGAER